MAIEDNIFIITGAWKQDDLDKAIKNTMNDLGDGSVRFGNISGGTNTLTIDSWHDITGLAKNFEIVWPSAVTYVRNLQYFISNIPGREFIVVSPFGSTNPYGSSNGNNYFSFIYRTETGGVTNFNSGGQDGKFTSYGGIPAGNYKSYSPDLELRLSKILIMDGNNIDHLGLYYANNIMVSPGVVYTDGLGNRYMGINQFYLMSLNE